MGTTTKVLCAILRFGELSSAVIVAALLGRFFYLVISCLEIVFAFILIVPLKYSFYAWPLDLLFFICSIVAFGLLAGINNSCSSDWYLTYWGYYWGRYWTVGPRYAVDFDIIDHAGCGGWRAILAFLFLGAMLWLFSSILGACVFLDMRDSRKSQSSRTFKEKLMRKKNQQVEPEHI